MQYNPTLHKLSNGVTVILDPMDLETVNVKVLFRTGVRDENPSEYGLTHFCEHMLCKGTRRFPSQRLMDDFLDYNGGVTNASTGQASMALYGRIIANNINVLIEQIGERLQSSLFAPEKIDTERTVIIDEWRRALDNPQYKLRDFISDKLFSGALFSTRAFGTEENIMSFTREQMMEFLHRRLSALNCIICVSGKINDADRVLAVLEKTFSFLPRTDVSENMELDYTPAIAHKLNKNNQNVKLRIFFPDICGNNYEDRFQSMCLGKFDKYMLEQLKEVVRRENGLVYGFGQSSVGNEKFNLTGFATETSAENISRVVALTAKTVHHVYNNCPFSDSDLERFARRNKLSQADWLESASSRCDRLISTYRDHGKIYDFYGDIKMSESIRRDDVVRYSRGYFDGPMSIITYGANFDANLNEIWHDNFK